jgi:hypothetical protein
MQSPKDDREARLRLRLLGAQRERDEPAPDEGTSKRQRLVRFSDKA